MEAYNRDGEARSASGTFSLSRIARKPGTRSRNLIRNVIGSSSAFCLITFCWFGILPCITCDANAASHLQVQTNYYSVTGSSLEEIRKSIRESRPWAVALDAQTDWKLKCEYKFREGSEGIVIDAFKIATRVVLTLPRWHPPRDAEPELHRQWWKYFVGLAAHEQGHVQIAREATAALERSIRELPTFSSAKEAKQTMQRIIEEIIRAHRNIERAYDVETRHGATQDAILGSGNQKNLKHRSPAESELSGGASERP